MNKIEIKTFLLKAIMDELVRKDSIAPLSLLLAEIISLKTAAELEALQEQWLSKEGKLAQLAALQEQQPLEDRARAASYVETLRTQVTELFKEKAEAFTSSDILELHLKKEYTQLQTLLEEQISLLKNEDDLESFRRVWLSRNGGIARLMQDLKERSLEEKKVRGPLLSQLKVAVMEAFEKKEKVFEQQKIEDQALRFSSFDVTAYKRPELEGSLHPYSQVIEHLENVLISMGFEIVDGPEVETDYYNFEALNIPKEHPARDMQDTFWLTIPGLLLRTHTSSVEIRVMSNRKPPLAIAGTGRVYRNEATDASHDFMFMQLEGLIVDKGISLANLFATMKSFLQAFFEKEDISIKIRPSYFPFVEPGVEIDMSCPFCTTGCSICKKTRWIEICGAGLCHPAVLRACNIDPDEYSGFAFGFGLTRLVMLKYGITDIRLFHSNKIDFLKQF